MKLCVVAAAFYEDASQIQLLVESCRELKLPLHLYGEGEVFANLREAKVLRLHEKLEKLKAEYILVTDAADSFLLAKESEILHKFFDFGKPIVISAEKTCYPQCSLATRYPISSTPWRYANSGGYIGKRDDLITLLRMLAKMKPEGQFRRSRDWENDQLLLSLAYCDGVKYEKNGLALDNHCVIFQTMRGANLEYGREFVWNENGRLVNKFTGTVPSVLHFNGNTPGMREAYEKSRELLYHH
jgi:hypothetical protein